jgi:membrane protein
MKKLWKRILHQNPHLEVWDHRLRVFTLPGLDGVAVYDVYKFFLAEIKSNSITIRSRAIAYSFFLSLFPAILFIFSLVPYVLSFYDPNNVNNYIIGLIKSISPSQDVFKFLWGQIGPLVREFTHKRPSVLTSTFVLTMFLMSNGVVAMMSSFDKTYDDYQRRTAIMTRLVALKISLLLVMLFIFSVLLIVMGHDMLEFLFAKLRIHDSFTKMLFVFIRYLSIIMLSFFSISLIYYYGPAVKKKYRFISTGATLATALSIFTLLIFSYYLNHYARYSKLYGPIGTVLAIMIWMNLNALVLLIGYEINVAIYQNRSIKQKHKQANTGE